MDTPAQVDETRGWPPFDPSAHPRVDLHSHTTLSDGALTPAQLIDLAAGVGLEVLAVTDHDTTEGLGEALEHGKARGLRIIPGMEVSADLDGRNLHVLAFFPARSLPSLAGWQRERRALRQERLVRMVEKLAELGAPVSLEAITQGADPRRSPGRLHVARALVQAGHVADVRAAFDVWLGAGKPAYVHDQVPSAPEAIALIKDLGGLSVAAHPSLDLLDPDLPGLARAGLDGVEAFHWSHTPEVAAHFQARADELGLLVTGGSDYHGDPPGPDGPPRPDAEKRLGHVPLPQAAWDRFAEALEARGA